jgi:dihydrofolate reductase/thymidylate synthase
MINGIVAVDNNYGFSKDGSIPWHISEDMKYFNEITRTKTNENLELQNAVIMGRKTWESLPKSFRPLSFRVNIIVSSTLECEYPGCHVFPTIETAIEKALHMKLSKEINEIFVIGGNSLYEHILNSVLLDKFYVSKIDHEYDCNIKINEKLLFNKCYSDMEQLTKYNVVDKKNNINTSIENYVFVNKNEFKGEQQYLKLMMDTLLTGEYRKTRNAYTWSKFSNQIKFNLDDGFPMTTTRKTFIKGIFYELMMFMLGESNTHKWLLSKNVKIWDLNTNRQFLDSVGLTQYEEGDLGYLYGMVWRHFGVDYKGMNENYDGKGIDQLANVIKLLKTDPHSRRILMTSYDPSKTDMAPLYPCHSLVLQFYVEDTDKLSVHMYQRSADLFLGLNTNIVSTSMIVHVLCLLINSDDEYNGPKFKPGNVTISLGDYHIYDTHIDSVLTQLSRNPLKYPSMTINKTSIQSVSELELSDVEVKNYDHHGIVRADMIA